MKKEMPYLPDIEKAVLAAVVIQGDLIGNVLASGITENSFYCPDCKKIFAAMLENSKAGQKIDLLTLAARLPEKSVEIAEISCSISTTAFIDSWILTLKQAEAARGLKLAAETAILNISGGKPIADIGDTVGELAGAVSKAGRLITGSNVRGSSEILSDYVESLKTTRQIIPYFPAGTEAARMLKHSRREMHVICANTGAGKTCLAAGATTEQLAAGLRVAYYCTESDSDSILGRIAAAVSGVSHYRVQFDRNSLRQSEITRLETALQFMKDNSDSLFIRGVETGIMTPEAIAADARAIISEHGRLDVIVIDFLQGLTVPAYMLKKERHSQIAYCVEELHRLFIETNTAGIVLAQINRDGQKSAALPGLEHIKDSSVIAQLSHTVSFLHRDQKDGGAEAVKFYSRKTRNQNPFVMELDFNGTRYNSKTTGYSQADQPN